jgi:hypothetical protein
MSSLAQPHQLPLRREFFFVLNSAVANPTALIFVALIYPAYVACSISSGEPR